MNLNKITSGLLAAMVMILTFSGCSEDFFEVPVGDRITPDQHYKDQVDAQTAMYGALQSLQDIAPSLILVDGLRTDQMLASSMANEHLREISNLNISADNPLVDNSALYRVIINTNEALGLIDIAANRDRDFTSDRLQDMRSALYGLRAWCYLNLARNYGKVTWFESNLSTLQGEGNDGLVLSKDALIDTLINQFHKDSVIFDRSVNSSTRVENVFFQFPNYKAVLGELYLEKNDYENAVYYLKLGLETVDTNLEVFRNARDYVYKVASYEEETWKDIFFSASNRYSENICVIPYNENFKQANEMVDYFLPEKSFMVLPAQHLIDSMEMALQARGTNKGDIYRGMGITYDTITGGEYFINKYNIDSDNPYSSDIILQRAGEIHLLLAEALNRSGRSDVALLLLNSGIANASPSERPTDFPDFIRNQGIRGRVGLAAREVSDTIPESQRIEIIEDLIIQEKAMECAFEGKRMSDLIRIAKRRDNPEEYLSKQIAMKYNEESLKQELKNYYMNEANWYLPSK